MSLQAVLKAIGIVVVGVLLLSAFVAMGPIGWVVIGTMVTIGVVQIVQKRRREGGSSGEMSAYCHNCGSSLDVETLDAENPNGSDWELNHCPSCGTPVAAESASESGGGPLNCPDCGAPNDPDETECTYCEAEL